jgi:hypothetical protein
VLAPLLGELAHLLLEGQGVSALFGRDHLTEDLSEVADLGP